MAECTIYVDWKDPVASATSSMVINLMREIQPKFEKDFKFVWTDSPYALSKRHNIGIHWDELPAIAVNTVQNFKHAYPRHHPFEKSHIVKWLGEVIQKKIDANL